MEITKEQLAEIIKTDEGKALIGEVAQGLGLRDTTGLEKKRDELLGEVRSLKDLKASLEGKYKPFEGLDPEEVKTALERFKSPDKFKDDDPRLNSLSLELKQIKGQLETERAEKEKYNRILEDKEKTSLIQSALKEAGFDPAYHGVLTTEMKMRAQLKRDESGRVSVVVAEGDDVNDIGEYTKAFAKSEAGKPFLPRPINTSANARQPGYVTPSSTVTRGDLRDTEKRAAAFEQIKSGKGVEITQS